MAKIIENKYERTCVRCQTSVYEGERAEILGFGVAHLDKECANKLELSKLRHPAGKVAKC